MITISDDRGEPKTRPISEPRWKKTTQLPVRRLRIDRREFNPTDYPHDPTEYIPSDHVLQRVSDNRRFLSLSRIAEAIAIGDRRPNGDGLGAFRLEVGDGVAYYVVAGFHVEGYRMVISAWPVVHHRRAALESGLWTPRALEVMEKEREKHDQSDGFEDEWPEYDDWLHQL